MRDWFTLCVVRPLDQSLLDRLWTAAVVLFVDTATVSMNWGADPLVYGRSSSPSHARFCGLTVGIRPVPGRTFSSSFWMRYVMCVRFYSDLRTQWCHRRSIPLKAPLHGSNNHGSSTLDLPWTHHPWYVPMSLLWARSANIDGLHSALQSVSQLRVLLLSAKDMLAQASRVRPVSRNPAAVVSLLFLKHFLTDSD